MHAFHGEGAHPLDGVDVLIAGSYGEGFARRMAARGIVVVQTEAADPLEAVRRYVEAARAGPVAEPILERLRRRGRAEPAGAHHRRCGHGHRRGRCRNIGSQEEMP